MNGFSLLPLQVLVQCKDAQESKEDPSSPHKVPDIMTIKEV